MPWYNTSTVSVTNNSATVTGAATAWVANAAAGMGFVGPDFGLYEIQSVNSDTSLTLAKVYRGSTASGQSYALMPTQDYIRTLASQVATLISTYSTIATAAGAGKFGDGTAASPGITFGANTNTGFYRPSANVLGLATNGVAAVVVDGNQNVGVGVTPSAWTSAGGKSLEIGSVGTAIFGSASLTTYTYNANFDSSWKYSRTDFASRYSQQAGAHQWFTAPSGTAGNAITFTQAMTLDASGNLLVGTATASAKLYVSGMAANGLTARFDSTNNATTPVFQLITTDTTGDSRWQQFWTDGTTLRGSIDYNRAGGLVRYNTTSDYRAKDIIGPVQDPGAAIDALKVYEGVMKGATQSRPMLIAHEAQAVAPYAVTGTKDAVDADGNPVYQQIDTSSLVPLLLAELQSLRARVAALEAA